MPLSLGGGHIAYPAPGGARVKPKVWRFRDRFMLISLYVDVNVVEGPEFGPEDMIGRTSRDGGARPTGKGGRDGGNRPGRCQRLRSAAQGPGQGPTARRRSHRDRVEPARHAPGRGSSRVRPTETGRRGGRSSRAHR